MTWMNHSIWKYEKYFWTGEVTHTKKKKKEISLPDEHKKELAQDLLHKLAYPRNSEGQAVSSLHSDAKDSLAD